MTYKAYEKAHTTPPASAIARGPAVTLTWTLTGVSVCARACPQVGARAY